jgi:hypothetical protein
VLINNSELLISSVSNLLAPKIHTVVVASSSWFTPEDVNQGVCFIQQHLLTKVGPSSFGRINEVQGITSVSDSLAHILIR